MTRSDNGETEEKSKIPFLRRLLIAESENVKIPSFELLPMVLEKLRHLFG